MPQQLFEKILTAIAALRPLSLDVEDDRQSRSVDQPRCRRGTRARRELPGPNFWQQQRPAFRRRTLQRPPGDAVMPSLPEPSDGGYAYRSDVGLAGHMGNVREASWGVE